MPREREARPQHRHERRGRAFPPSWLTPAEIGYRAGDGARGAISRPPPRRPSAHLLAISAPPRVGRRVCRPWSDGIGDAAREAGTLIVGGDTTTGPVLALTVTVAGAAERPLDRAGARPGDRVYVTGRFGGPGRPFAPGSGARNRTPRRVHASRTPPRAFARADGLPRTGPRRRSMSRTDWSPTSGHLAAASGVQLSVDLDRVPRWPGVIGLDAAASGEEYELAVTAAPPIDTVAFEREFGVPLTHIGDVRAGQPRRSRSLSGGRALTPSGLRPLFGRSAAGSAPSGALPALADPRLHAHAARRPHRPDPHAAICRDRGRGRAAARPRPAREVVSGGSRARGRARCCGRPACASECMVRSASATGASRTGIRVESRQLVRRVRPRGARSRATRSSPRRSCCASRFSAPGARAVGTVPDRARQPQVGVRQLRDGGRDIVRGGRPSSCSPRARAGDRMRCGRSRRAPSCWRSPPQCSDRAGGGARHDGDHAQGLAGGSGPAWSTPLSRAGARRRASPTRTGTRSRQPCARGWPRCSSGIRRFARAVGDCATRPADGERAQRVGGPRRGRGSAGRGPRSPSLR